MLLFYILSVGAIRVTSPPTPINVSESDSPLHIGIAVALDIFILERELVYAVQLLSDTAERELCL